MCHFLEMEALLDLIRRWKQQEINVEKLDGSLFLPPTDLISKWI
jgi:hypothetical protein